MMAHHFFRANLENHNLSGQIFDGADFREANMRNAILEDVSCEPIIVPKTGQMWLLFLISGEPFLDEAMKPADFSKADLTAANLKHAKLREARFHSAILRNANLSGANLANADLIEADLSNANLSYAEMSGALLYKTNLEGADLTGAKLDGADLEDANLKNAILYGVDMRKIRNLGSANLSDADLSYAIMPKTAENRRPILRLGEAMETKIVTIWQAIAIGIVIGISATALFFAFSNSSMMSILINIFGRLVIGTWVTIMSISGALSAFRKRVYSWQWTAYVSAFAAGIAIVLTFFLYFLIAI